MKTFQQFQQQFNEYGVVEELRYPLVYVRGLPGIAHGEVVMFEPDILGQVIGFNEELIEVLVFSQQRLTPGIQAVRTGEQVTAPIGDNVRGQVINPVGIPLIGKSDIPTDTERRPIDVEPPHISARAAITKQFLTGTTAVDLLLPLARGQREAIIGDPTTGKNSFLLTALRAHAETDIVIYAAIGKPWNDIKKSYNFITQQTKKENVVVVAASADDAISLIYLTPFTAMTIAEHWRDAGHNVLLILDDLSTHARFYREIGLLARRFPARESYPGDIFHLHARLLERAGNFKHPKKGEVAITCLPVAETVEGDVTGYIVSNLISITDGHLLFDETIFSQGRRPAINIPLSVTRVGSHTQTKLIRDLNRKLMVLLNRHEEAQRFTHFGAELPEDLKRILDAGDALHDFLSQPLYLTVPYPIQVIVSSLIWMGWLNEHKNRTEVWRDGLQKAYATNKPARRLIDELLKAPDLDTYAQQLKAQKKAIMELCPVPEKSTTR